ncbi:RDD family protein [Hyalangium rubrum]|uniref:RDD family protein n=1 Tax=Hyalangium rubrum TaxID=3103134 RepID=A0ABU5GYM6_9BACT|nr:RDD family protein [Hyalangium sp. s54d21]MDY7226260.1 RDD family protein [Hyalangium sp. s54d21]
MELSPSMVVEVASNSSAGFGLRLAARLIDVMFGLLVMTLGGMVGSVVLEVLAARGLVQGNWTTALQLASPAGVVWGTLGGLLYQMTAEAVGGATLGKLILRLRVTAEDLTPSSFKGALLRNLALCVDALCVPAYLAMSRSIMNQRYGDQWGGTVVLRASSVLPDARKGTGLILLGLFSGSTLWGLCIVLSCVLRAL